MNGKASRNIGGEGNKMKTRIFLTLVLCLPLYSTLSALAQTPPLNSSIQSGQSYQNDVSPALRDFPVVWPPNGKKRCQTHCRRDIDKSRLFLLGDLRHEVNWYEWATNTSA